MTSELEMILAEGAGLQPGFSCSKILEKRNRARLAQINLVGRETQYSEHFYSAVFRDTS